MLSVRYGYEQVPTQIVDVLYPCETPFWNIVCGRRNTIQSESLQISTGILAPDPQIIEMA